MRDGLDVWAGCLCVPGTRVVQGLAYVSLSVSVYMRDRQTLCKSQLSADGDPDFMRVMEQSAHRRGKGTDWFAQAPRADRSISGERGRSRLARSH